MKACSKCKKENEDVNVFCGSCGQRLDIPKIKASGCLSSIFIFAILIVFMFKACGDSPEVTAKKASDLKLAQEKVKVTFKVQDIYEYKRKIVVFIKNESDKTFSGSVTVKFGNSINEVLHTDYIYPEKVAAGSQTYAIFFLPLCDGYQMYSDVYNAKFE